MHIGTTLRLLRLHSGLGLRDLARRVGVSSSYLSRVESGLDPAPTAARLGQLARELGVDAPALIAIGERVGPYLNDYIEQVPEAGALFLELAHLRLNAEQIADLRGFLLQRFPAQFGAAMLASARRGATPRLSDLVDEKRVVVGLRCVRLADALAIAAGRLAPTVNHEPALLTALLEQRELAVPSAIGGGVAVPYAPLKGASDVAAIVTLASPLTCETPDGIPLSTLVVLCGEPGGAGYRGQLASVSRLAAVGLAEMLARCTSSGHLVAQLTWFEGRG